MQSCVDLVWYAWRSWGGFFTSRYKIFSLACWMSIRGMLYIGRRISHKALRLGLASTVCFWIVNSFNWWSMRNGNWCKVWYSFRLWTEVDIKDREMWPSWTLHKWDFGRLSKMYTRPMCILVGFAMLQLSFSPLETVNQLNVLLHIHIKFWNIKYCINMGMLSTTSRILHYFLLIGEVVLWA